MTRRTAPMLFAVGVLIAWATASYGEDMKGETWRVVEIRLSSAKDRENPYRDVELEAVFRRGDVAIRRPGFWDGGKDWKIRFAPTAPGTWTYVTTCSDAGDGGLHGKTGTIEVAAYRGDNPNYVHGFLKVKAGDGPLDRRYFVYDDGTPFFWLGDTHWQMPDRERVAECNHPDHKGGPCPYGGQFQHLVQQRKALGFTAYQTYPSVDFDHVTKVSHWWLQGYDKVNPERFRAVYDVMMDYLADNGFVTALGLGHFSAAEKVPAEDMKRWARYHVARYGAHPVVWITAQEPLLAREHREVWRQAAVEIHEQDAYGHPLSHHQIAGYGTPWWNEPWHDWGCAQSGHDRRPKKGDYARFWWCPSKQPWLESECNYEGLKGGRPDPKMVRLPAYVAKLCGSFGYTYGGSGVWLFGWDEKEVKMYGWVGHPWNVGMEFPGAKQMAHFRTLFTSMKWWELTPCFDAGEWQEFAHPEESVQAKSDDVRVVYFRHADTATGKLKGLDGTAAYKAEWFDPRTGERKAIAPAARSANGEWTIPDKPDAEDWVLVLTRAEAPRPGQEGR